MHDGTCLARPAPDFLGHSVEPCHQSGFGLVERGPGAHDRQGYAAAIASPSPDSLSASTATALIVAAKAGGTEVLGALDGAPLLVVELGDDDMAVPTPSWLPAVVVAVARRLPERPAPLGADVALCPAAEGSVPSGWVAVADPDEELERLSVAVCRHPRSSVVLAQVLRLSTALDTESAMLAESLAYSTLLSGPDFAAWLSSRAERNDDGVEPDDVVLVSRHGARLVITLNRPHVRNAVDRRLRDGLSEALALAAIDPSITEIELAGAGPDFSSGGDLNEFGSAPDAVTAHLVRTGRSPARLLAATSERVTAHLHGACIGAGIELAAFAGRVVAAADTTCQLPELTLGLIPGSGGTVSIPRRIGRHRCAWMAESGTPVDAATALEWGLVDEVLAG